MWKATPVGRARRGFPLRRGDFEEGASMEMLGNPSWRWGLSLIVLTMTIHAAAVLIMAFVGTRIRVQLETRSLRQWNLIAILICTTGLIGLILAMLHGIECGIWAAAYLWLGAVDSQTDALLYSI